MRLSVPLILAALLLPAGSAANLVDDDAGTGRDGADHPALAAPIGPGSHAGRLSDGLDLDHFVLHPPNATLVNVTVVAPGNVETALVDPEGIQRADRVGSGALVAIGAPSGDWTLRVRFLSPTAGAAPYALGVAFDAHAAVHRVDATGDALFFLSEHATGTWSRLELRILPQKSAGSAPYADAGVKHFAVLEGASIVRRVDAFEGGNGIEDRVVADTGAAPGVSFRLPSSAAGPGVTTGFAALAVEDAGQGQTVRVGAAQRYGVRIVGWELVDGTQKGAFVPGASGLFLTAADMQGERVAAGPLASGADLAASFHAPSGSTTLVLADATRVPGAMGAPQAALFRDGVLVGQRTNDYVTFYSNGDHAGAWRLEARNVEGAQRGRALLMSATFPAPHV